MANQVCEERENEFRGKGTDGIEGIPRRESCEKNKGDRDGSSKRVSQ